MVADNAALTVSAMMADPRYGSLSDEGKAYVEARLDLCLRIDSARNKRAAILAETRRTHAGAVLSEGTIRKVYYDRWLAANRDWFELRNKAKTPTVTKGLPPAFVDHWHQRCADFRGKHKAAWRSIQRDWKQRILPPGFEDSTWSQDMPDGMSYETLMRGKYRPDAVQDAMARHGIRAAYDLVPGVLTTRAGLAFGSRWVFDDMWHDHKVMVPGQSGLRRLLQFHCIELLSACQAARGMKPELLNDRSGKFERLKEKELLFLLVHVLCNLGYNADACWLMMEHGTASVSERVEKHLFDASAGALKIMRGSIGDGAVAPGLFGGQSRGNFKFKAALESLGNLVHNEMSDRRLMPAQTGSNSRTDAVDDLYGRDRNAAQLVKVAATLPPAVREQLRFGAPSLWQAIEIADRIQEEMNQRTEHELEGWNACGFLTTDWRTHKGAPWQPASELAALAPALRDALRLAMESDPSLTNPRRMSPREVFDLHRPQLTRLPAHFVPLIVGMEHATERKLGKDGRFHFDDMEVGPDTHHYEGLCYASDGEPCRLPAGEKFATFVSTIDPTRMHLCDARGSYVGWVQRTLVPTHGDATQMAHAYGQKQQAARELLAPAVAAGRGLMRRDAEAAEHNADLVRTAQAGEFVRPAEPETAGEKRSRQSTNLRNNRSDAERARRLREQREKSTY
ncbi:hypothetical protein [Actomonas aquatica]|uniref:Uncharacterized protein n=1 Tax=Actomonas aquatica TaxID=2866162 RepID=A0ABZ1CCJ8_9BACT|nr:hypothetical protein [Opitutus sp. WL0086]WRQ89381.1 hypothetical protein K1X11_008165 [Opitutus sp. WL0086]